MSRLVEFYKKYLAGINKYRIVTIVFLAVTFFIGDSNLLTVVGALLYITHWNYAPYLFAFGVAGVSFISPRSDK